MQLFLSYCLRLKGEIAIDILYIYNVYYFLLLGRLAKVELF